MKKLWLLLLSLTALTGCGTNTKTPTTEETSSIESSLVKEESQSSGQEVSRQVDEDSQSDEAQEEKAIINLTVDGEKVDSIEVAFKQDSYLLDVMKAHLDVDETDGFIKSINGYEQNEDEKKYWMFDVNGEMATVGAGDYILHDGDTVDWKLEVVNY